MECPNSKPMKPNSNISETVCKFAKVCKLKSVGVFSTEISNLHHLQKPICNDAPLSKNSSNASEVTRSCGQKIHPKPTEVPREDACASLEIMKIFDTVSDLKLACLRLQQALIPYNPQKIIAADDRVNTELGKISKFKREYKEKQYRTAQFNTARSDILKAAIEAK